MANKKELVIGIDIGTHAMKVCQLQPSGKEGYRLLAAGSAALPAEAVEDGDLKEQFLCKNRSWQTAIALV